MTEAPQVYYGLHELLCDLPIEAILWFAFGCLFLLTAHSVVEMILKSVADESLYINEISDLNRSAERHERRLSRLERTVNSDAEQTQPKE